MSEDFPLKWSEVISELGVYERQAPIDGNPGRFVVVIEDRKHDYIPFLLVPNKKGKPYSLVYIDNDSVLRWETHPEDSRVRWRKVNNMHFCGVLIMDNADDD